MSYDLYSKAFSDPLSCLDAEATLPRPGEFVADRGTADRVLDEALRSVPLPEGLMTRLGRLVYSMPHETADQVDWLGC
jgi:hypothetical protein